MNLGAQHRHTAWSIDSKFDPLAVDGEHRNRDVFANKQALLAFAAQNEHAYSALALTWAILCVVV